MMGYLFAKNYESPNLSFFDAARDCEDFVAHFGKADSDQACTIAVCMPVGIQQESVAIAQTRNRVGDRAKFVGQLLEQEQLLIGLTGGSDDSNRASRRFV